MTYALYLGCLIPNRLPFLEKTSARVLDALGIQYETLKGASCCYDPVVLASVDYKTGVAVAARNLALAEEMGMDVLTLCNGCFSSLKEARHGLLEDDEKRAEVNAILSRVGKVFKGSSDVRHVAELLSNDIGPEGIRAKVTRELRGLKVAAHPGCHLLRPGDVLGVDDTMLLDKLAEWTGAEPVQYDEKLDCCGTGTAVAHPEAAVGMLADKLEGIRRAGADVVLTACPTCFVQFEFQQKKAAELRGWEGKIPVLFVTELLGLAFGFNAEEMGLKYHKVKVGEKITGSAT